MTTPDLPLAIPPGLQFLFDTTPIPPGVVDVVLFLWSIFLGGGG